VSRSALALVVAAGRSRRMGGGNKLLVEAAGRPVLAWTLEVFQRSPRIARIYVTSSPEDIETYLALAAAHGLSKVAGVLEGGAERQESVHIALRHIASVDPSAGDDPLIAVHDGARPLLRDTRLEELLQAASARDGALLGVPAKETMKRVATGGRVVETVPREELMVAQTPQVFRLHALLAAHDLARADGFAATDDAMLMERAGHPVHIVTGDYDNIKITTPEDLVSMEGLLARRAAPTP